MIKLKKLIALGLSSLTSMCFIGMPNTECKINANASYECDVNGDGKTSVSDAVCILQYLLGLYNIPNPEVADFNNDGFISQADATGIQYLDIGITVPINADYTPSKPTTLNVSDVTYNRYNASTGAKISEYTVPASLNIGAPVSIGLIGNEDRVEDYSHSAICMITTNDNKKFTGFVASDNSILTAGSCLLNKKIRSITFYDSKGKETSLIPNVIDYSIPKDYGYGLWSDYALITVSNDLSAYNNLYLGYALQRAVDTQADVMVTGYQTAVDDDTYKMRTGKGRIGNLTSSLKIHYDCDTSDTAIGAPVYADLIFEGEHYYTVVGINTGDSINSNAGVRMCPNITNLIRNNLK